MLVATFALVWMVPGALGTCDVALQSCNAADASSGRTLFQTSKASLVTETAAEDAGHDCYSKYDGQRLLRLTPCTQEAADTMLEADCTNLNDEIGFVVPGGGGRCVEEEAICSEAITHYLHTLFPGHVEVISFDAGAFFREKSGVSHAYHSAEESDGVLRSSSVDAFYTDWRPLSDRQKQWEQAVKDSNGEAVIEEIGQSVEKRNITAVRLTGRNFKKGSPRVLFTFNLHAREWISGMAGVYAVEKMAAKAKNEPEWLTGVEVLLVPMSNPDGFLFSYTNDRFWRKNRAVNSGPLCKCTDCNGVDLNRNFDTAWGRFESGSPYPCKFNYRGPHARSEPESQAIAGIIDSGLAVHVDVHSYGEVILSPWGYTTKPHPRFKEVVDLQNKMKDAIKSKHGKTYRAGDNIWRDAAGVLTDYSSSTGALGFTLEVRPYKCNATEVNTMVHLQKKCARSGTFEGFAPSKQMILPTAEEVLEGLYAAVAWAQAKGSVAPSPSPATDCSFEKRGSCIWSNTKGDQFDWKLQAGPTKSKETGPSSAVDGKKYVYIETSKRKKGDMAILITPPLILPQPKQLRFKYHMYGVTMGSLNVTVDGKSVWHVSGNQGNKWKDGMVDLSQYTGKYPTVAFVGTAGSSWTGDAAIDAVKFVSSTTSPQSSAADCNFEQGFCNWSQISNPQDQFDWTLKSGGTPSANTGPGGAADGNNYVFIETSSPRRESDRAMLTSPPLILPRPKKLIFKYHMHGRTMGSLNVLVGRDNVWHEGGDHGNAWKDGEVDLSNYTGKNPTITFVGVTGSSWKSDVAIDAVKLVSA